MSFLQRRYIEDYAKHFNILDKVKLNTAVTSVSQRSDGQRGWTVTTRSKESGAETKEDVDFLVVGARASCDNGLRTAARP